MVRSLRMTSTQTAGDYQVVGSRPVRPDGTDKVTGRAQYGADVRPQGMLYGRVLRSPHAHAKIKSIDASEALAMDGVQAVITAADFPDTADKIVQTYRGPIPQDWHRDHLMASDTVLHRGQPVAALCANDPHVAEDALALIKVDYEVMTPVLSIDEATSPSAPILFDNEICASIPGLFDPIEDRPTNIARRLEMSHGDLEAGFEDADVIVEREFETGTYHQGYIEPHTATALWDRDGQLTIWNSSQGHFGGRDQLAELFQMPISEITVVPMEIGGGFGGKTILYLEPVAALLSKQTGRPVQVNMTRTEVLEASGPTSASKSRARIGAKRDGTIVAAEVHIAYEAGAFPGAPMPSGVRCALGPYDVPNQLVEGYEVVVNKPKTAAYRAPGAPQSGFAVESVLDELAEQLDIDPIELRQKNAATEGTMLTDGSLHGPIGNLEVIKAAEESPHYRSELQGKNQGRGMALGFWFNGGNESSAYANVDADGTVSLVVGSVDIGGQRAALAMQFAETMGIPYESVRPLVADTNSVGFTATTGGSRVTFASGWAVHEAALDVQRELETRAASIWEVDRELVSYDNDGVIRGPDGRSFTFQEIAAELPDTGGRVQGRADVKPGGVGAALAAHIVDVEVDPETGKVDILRYTAVQDVGTAVHPSYVEGQIQGGAAQGIGMALSEEYVFDESGNMRNASFLDYRMPTALDLPNIDTVLVEVPNPGHPYGVRGVGEVPIIPPLAAVANAIYDAIGVRMPRIPASPQVILEELLPDGE